MSNNENQRFSKKASQPPLETSSMSGLLKKAKIITTAMLFGSIGTLILYQSYLSLLFYQSPQQNIGKRKNSLQEIKGFIKTGGN